MFSYYFRFFKTAEINSTVYRYPSRSMIYGLKRNSSRDFVFSPTENGLIQARTLRATLFASASPPPSDYTECLNELCSQLYITMLVPVEGKDKKVWKELEAGLGSGSRFRVLVYLVMNPKQTFTKYALVKATGLRSPAVAKQLKTLLDLGWIRKYDYSPITYQINLEKEVVRLIYEFFSELRLVRT